MTEKDKLNYDLRRELYEETRLQWLRRTCKGKSDFDKYMAPRGKGGIEAKIVWLDEFDNEVPELPEDRDKPNVK